MKGRYQVKAIFADKLCQRSNFNEKSEAENYCERELHRNNNSVFVPIIELSLYDRLTTERVFYRGSAH